METLTVCTYLTETPTDQTRELSSDHKSRAQLAIVIEVGKAVISVPFAFLWIVIQKKYLFIFHFDLLYQPEIFPIIITQPCKINQEISGKIFVKFAA